jgi:integrase
MPEDVGPGVSILPYVEELRSKIQNSEELKEYTKEQLIYYLEQLVEQTNGTISYDSLYWFITHSKKAEKLSPSSIATRHRIMQSLLSKLIEILIDKKESERVLMQINDLKHKLKLKFKRYSVSARDWYIEVEQVKELLTELDGIKLDLCVSYLYLGCRRRELVNLSINNSDRATVTIHTAKSREVWEKELKFRRFGIDRRILPYIERVSP